MARCLATDSLCMRPAGAAVEATTTTSTIVTGYCGGQIHDGGNLGVGPVGDGTAVQRAACGGVNASLTSPPWTDPMAAVRPWAVPVVAGVVVDLSADDWSRGLQVGAASKYLPLPLGRARPTFYVCGAGVYAGDGLL
jgi:hypothetical protein